MVNFEECKFVEYGGTITSRFGALGLPCCPKEEEKQSKLGTKKKVYSTETILPTKRLIEAFYS